jgi:hypothetical protein
MAEERARHDRAGKRRQLPASARHGPFAWALAASLLAGLLINDQAYGWRLRVHTDAGVWIAFVVEVVALLLPVMVAVRWRGVGRGARASALLACALWWTLHWGRVHLIVRDMPEFIPNRRVVAAMVREPRRAMRTDHSDAAARALAAGDSSFLAVGGTCGTVPGVDSAVARRRGVRVITGTHDDGPPLTNEHRAFQLDALDYAERYNGALAKRLGIEAVPPGGEHGRCYDPTTMRGRAPLLWP